MTRVLIITAVAAVLSGVLGRLLLPVLRTFLASARRWSAIRLSASQR